MSTASLGGAVPAPDDNSALDRLISAIEKLAGNRGGGGGRKGSAQSGGMSAEDMDKKLLAEQGKRYKLEMEIHRTTYDVMARLSKYRMGLEKQHTDAAKKLAAQRSRALEAQMKAEESAQKVAEKKVQKQTESTAKRLTNLIDSIGDKLASGGVLTNRDRRRMSRAGVYSGIVQGFESTSQANAQERLGRNRQKQTESLEKLEAKWLKRERDDRENYKAKVAAENEKLDREGRLQASSAFKALNEAKAKRADAEVIAELELQADSYKLAHEATYELNRKREADAKKLANENAKFDREGMQTAHNAMAVYRAAKQKQAEKIAANDLKEEEQARDKAHNAFYALDKKREKQAKAEADAIDKFQKGIGYKVKAGMNLTRGDLRQSMFLGSRYSDFIRNEIEQREAQKNGKVDEKKGGGWSSFFGGFARNLIIGKLYSAAHFALTPLMALGAGLSSGGVRVWSSLTEAALEAGKQLYHLTGAGDAFTTAEYDLKTFSQRLKKINAREEMGFGLGAKASAGIIGAGSSLTRGVSDAFTNAIVNPLTGLIDIVSKVGNAVSLFDPSTMVRYNLVLRELTAVIGMTMTPVVQGITTLLKEFGDYLKPLAQTLTPEISNMMRELVEAIKPLIPLIIIELKDAVKTIIDELKKVKGNRLGIREKVLAAAGVPDPEVKEQLRGDARILGKGLIGGGGGALLGAPFGPMGMAVGGAFGFVASLIAAKLDENKVEAARVNARAARVNQEAANLPKGNLMGTAVAYNATIGGGMELARRAAQDAFIASSNNGKSQGMPLFEEAAKLVVEWLKNQGMGKDKVNGNIQPGMANGAVAPIDFAGAFNNLGAFGKIAKAQFGF